MPSSARPTPSDPGYPRLVAGFATLPEALDYAARGQAGVNIYSGRGELAEQLPYRDLREQALGQARRFRGAGLTPGDRVVLVADNDGDFIRIFFACQYAGLVPVPLPLPVAFAGSDVYTASLRRMIIASGAATTSARPRASAARPPTGPRARPPPAPRPGRSRPDCPTCSSRRAAPASRSASP